jgi:DNA modification methylase
MTTKKLSDFKPTKRNSNRHTAPGMDSLEKSMGQVGYFEPMTAVADGEIISGDARLEVSARMFGDDVIVVEHDGTKPIIGVRTDIPNAEHPTAKQIHYAANMTAAINLDLDPQIVIEDLEAGLDLSDVGISDLDLAGLMPDIDLNGNEDAGRDTEPEVNRADELREEWGTRVGQLWSLGEHRLVIGDCTDPAVVEMVMGGEKADMVFTDPPYNVNYGGNQSPIWGANVKTIHNDNMSADEWRDFQDMWFKSIFLVTDGAIYVCMSAKEWGTTREAFVRNGGHWSSDIIWVKDRFVPGRKDYHSRYEAILYGWASGGKREWNGERLQDDVWEFRRNHVNDLHPTMKPVELVERGISNSSSAEGVIFDPFVGSGTTIIAAHNLNRIARAVELDPGYAAVCLDRFKRHTSIQPALIGGN